MTLLSSMFESRLRFNQDLDTLSIFRVPVWRGDVRQLAIEISQKPVTSKQVVTINTAIWMNSRKDAAMAEIMGDAYMVTLDGMPFVQISRLMGVKAIHRVTGSDLLSEILTKGGAHTTKVALLGVSPEVLTKLRHLQCQVAAFDLPHVESTFDLEMLNELAYKVAAFNPDATFVLLGSPKQDVVIRHLIKSGICSWFIGAGAAFDFLLDPSRRAPKIIQRLSLEWIWRLALEPKRLTTRYLPLILPTFGLAFTSIYFARIKPLVKQ